MANNQNRSGNNGYNQPSYTTTTGGKNPRQIHIAHRRSPSELTSLMSKFIYLQLQQAYILTSLI